MKKIVGTSAMAFISIAAICQQNIGGSITNATTHKPVAGATISINRYTSFADDKGQFVVPRVKKGVYILKVSCVGFKEYEEQVSVGGSDITLDIQLKEEALYLQSLEVKSIRAASNAPFAKTNISKDDIAQNNLGQDLPFLLNQTPSVVINSDAGNGVGYTAIHIRGTDATRINVTMNGIPYNDAESQGTYFVDIPDFSSSLSSIQVQRGAGPSSNGTGAFGATINLQTNELNDKAYAEVNNSYGSYNTWKNTVKVGTGLINDHFTVDARLSQISSDGYIDRASSSLKSFAFSTAYLTKNASIRFNIFSGKEKTYQAWYGVPDYIIDSARTYNQAGTEKPGSPYNNQTDNYQQDHYQLFYNQSINSRWSFNTAVFMTYGRGYYEEYKGVDAETAAGDNSQTSYAFYGLPNVVHGVDTTTNTDLIRQLWLDNHFYGQIGSFQYKTQKDEVTFGGGWTRYEGSHFGNIMWAEQGGVAPGYQYYKYPVLKTDENIYVKWQHKFSSSLYTYADMQYRQVYHRINGFEGSAVTDPLSLLMVTKSFNFFNPKAGITYMKNNWKMYLSYALANKEPNHDDLATLTQTPKAETLHDFELGAEYKYKNLSYGINLYYMLYKDQLVVTGKLNDVGSYTRVNVDNSYRAGIELQGAYTFTKWLNATANLTLSQNKINAFTEYVDNWDNGGQNTVNHSNTDISFSPNVVSGNSINFLPCKRSVISFLGKYVSKQYLDNTQDNARCLQSYYAEDLRMSYCIKNKGIREWNFILQLNNIFNAKYNSNGWTYPYISGSTLVNSNGYFPMAPTNFMMAVNMKF